MTEIETAHTIQYDLARRERIILIQFIEDKRVFHLFNHDVSFVLALIPDRWGNEELLMTYYGKRLNHPECTLRTSQWREGASFDSPRQLLPYACPTDGRGDFRPPMLRVLQENGGMTAELFFQGYEIVPGKPDLQGLPSVYTEDDSEAETLLIRLFDRKTKLMVQLAYTIYAERPVVTASCKLVNQGENDLLLDQAASVTLSLPGSYDMIHLHGAWAKERQVERIPAGCMTRSIGSVRGASGHEHNPFAVLALPQTTEHAGDCFGVSLVYSGDFEMTVDENAYHTTRLVAGIHPRHFSWHLHAGESFQTPEAVLVFSENGLNGMSQSFHSLYRERLCRGEWRDRQRPVLINNWEATYFDFNPEKILAIARAGKEIGVEMFVLDDGWFGKRNNDDSSLGDWYVNEQKLPGGLKSLSASIHDLGLQFGIWVEPEMISPDSDLYRAHPDWCLHESDRMRTEARNQLILDLTRTEVQDYIISSISKVIGSGDINYVKWDMNRNFAEFGSESLRDGREGETSHRYMLGLYRVLHEITSRFPHVLFESCSGGGGRFDPGILAYMPQTWTSDDTDAEERLRIQYGTSYCYPASAMGAHVSAVPNHQIGRSTPIRTRCEVALGGNFGFELDLTKLTKEEIEEVRRQISRVKEIRETTAQGAFTRLLSPYEGNITAWQFADEKRLVVCAYRTLAHPNDRQLPIRLHGLCADAEYVDEKGNVYSANDLMAFGIQPDLPQRDFSSWVMVLIKKEN